MTDFMQGIITIVIIVVIAVIAIILIKWLISATMLAPIAYASTDLDKEDTNDEDNNIAPQTQKTVDKETIDIGNNTEVTITCTSNIPNLVSCD